MRTAKLLGTLLGLCLAPAAFAGDLAGLHRVELELPTFRNNQLLVGCERIGDLGICYQLPVWAGPGGKIAEKTGGTAQVAGSLDGVPVSGVLPIEVTGSVKGVAGDGVTPSSKLELRIRARKVALTVDGEARQTELSASLSGVIDHTGIQFTVNGKRTLAIKGLRKSAGRIGFLLSNPARVETWTLDVSLDPANKSKLSGSAVLSHEAVGWFAFGVSGSESKKTGLAKLSFRPGKPARGATLRIDDVDVTQDPPRFELAFKLFGVKGVVSSLGPNASLRAFHDDWRSQGVKTFDPVELSGVMPFHGTVGDEAPSYYVVRGLKPNRAHLIDLERLDGVTDLVPEIGGDLGCGYRSAPSDWLLQCWAVTDRFGDLHFGVTRHDGEYDGGRFRLRWRPGVVEDEGEPSDPLDITPPYTGAARSQGWYRITNLVPGETYTLAFYGSAEFVVTGDFNDRSQDRCSPKGDYERCGFVADGTGEILIVATALSHGPVPAQYSILLAAGGVANQGSAAAPLDVTGELPFQGMLSDDFGSHYRVTGLVPGAPYTTTVRDAQRYVVTSLYAARWGDGQADCYNGFVQVGPPVECVARADASGALVLWVQPHPQQGGPARFTVELAAGGLPNEGYPDQPLDVTGQLPRVSTVYALGQSWYAVNGLGSQPVTVSIANVVPYEQCFNLSAWVYASDGTELCSLNCNVACTFTPPASGAMTMRVGSILEPITFTFDVQ